MVEQGAHNALVGGSSPPGSTKLHGETLMTVQMTTLPNGFTIMTDAVPTMQSCMVGLYVRSGSRHERPDEHGVAHFIEHMLFRRTKNRGSMQIMSDIENAGGSMNAFTSYERTFYHFRMMEDHVPLAVDILADMMRNSLMDPNDMELERKTILQELTMLNDEPRHASFDHFQNFAYPGQGMGKPIIGTAESIGNLTRDSMMNFWNRMYPPNRMTLGIVGNADHSRMVDMAESLFGDMEGADAPEDAKAEFMKDSGRREENHLLNETIDHVHVAIGLECPHEPIRDVTIAKMHAAIMGGTISSRLFKNAREKGLCYAIMAHVDARSDCAAYLVETSATPANARELTNAVFNELKGMTDKVEDHEISKIKELSKHNILKTSEDCEMRLISNLESLHYRGKILDNAEKLEMIDSISASDIKEFGRRLMNESPCLMTTYGPDNDIDSIDRLFG